MLLSPYRARYCIMYYELRQEELENTAKRAFEQEIEMLGIVSPSIECLNYCQDTMEWEFRLVDSSYCYGGSPELAALDWLVDFLPIDVLDERSQSTYGLEFQDYYLATLRVVSGEYAA